MTANVLPAPLHRLCAAVNDHDLDALADCFTSTYENETPAHPGRSFSGTEQVRRNWGRIFASFPDVRARVVDVVRDGAAIWSEWELAGSHPDKRVAMMRGVIIFEVTGDRFSSSRFYLEQVDDGADGHDGAVSRLIDEPWRSSE